MRKSFLKEKAVFSLIIGAAVFLSGCSLDTIQNFDKAKTNTGTQTFSEENIFSEAYSYSVPDGWVKSDKYSDEEKIFYIKDGFEGEEYPDNISVSFGTNRYSLDEHEKFRDAIVQQLLSQSEGIDAQLDGDGTYTRQGDILYIFTIDETDVVTKQYYVVKDYEYCLIHATNFSGSDDIFEAAQSMVDSLTWGDEEITATESADTDSRENSRADSFQTENTLQNSLPEKVVLSILGNVLSDNDLSEVVFFEDGVWSTAFYEGFSYLAETAEGEFKRYNVGDEICGLKLTSASNTFSNEYMDNEYHEDYRCSSVSVFEGVLTLSGTLKITENDGENLITKKGDIIFSPEKDVFPVISGLPDNRYCRILCGNISGNVIPELSALPLGEEIEVEITVSDIALYSAMPVDAYAMCRIDSIALL